MNCDQAFDELTNPARRNSADLQRHLAACPRCRQMQDVLAPAIDLLAPGETEPADAAGGGLPADAAGGGLPTHAASATAESILLAERTAAELARTKPAVSPVRRFVSSAFVRYAAVFLLGVGFTFAATSIGDRPSPASDAVGNAADCLWVQHTEQNDQRFQAGAPVVVASCVGCHRGGQ